MEPAREAVSLSRFLPVVIISRCFHLPQPRGGARQSASSRSHLSVRSAVSHRCFYLRSGIRAFFGCGGINLSHVCPQCTLECNNRSFVQALSAKRLLHPCYFILILHGKTFCPAFQIDTEHPWPSNKRNKLCSRVICAAFRECLVI